MKFANPHMFYLIWLVVIFWGFIVYGNRKRSRVVKCFISSSLINTMIPGYSMGRKWLKGTLLTLSLLFLVLALTGPLAGFRWEEVKEKGVDIMIALDCSRSMLATDIKPTRLEQAKREIVDLLNMMHSDRAGLVAFAGSSILQCPLTLDHSGFTIFLNALNPDFLPMGGTDISGALQTAVNGFESGSNSEKAIIIITDGESTSGDPVAIATEAAKKGVRIFCIGVGQEDGAPVPDSNGGFKKDDSGKIIMSKVDDEGLRKIAAVGNGLYVKSVAGDMDLDQIYTGEIQKNMKKTTLHSGKTKVWENRFQWMLFPAVLLLIAEMSISERRKIKQGFFILALMVGIFSSLILHDMTIGSRAYASSAESVKKGLDAYEQGKYDDALKNFIDAQLERPDLPELYYNIGSAAYKKEDYESALNNFARAKESKDQTLREKSVFNTGNTKYRMGDLDGAIKEFEQIPEESELYNEAKENLEFVKKKIEERKKQEQEQKDKEKSEQDKQNQDQKNQDQQNQEQKEQKEQSQKNRDKDQKEQKSQDQSKKEQEKREQGEQNKQDQKKEESQEDNQQKEGQQEQSKDDQKDAAQQAQNSETGGEKGENQQQSRQHLLNRLEDKPGSAMMPAYSGEPVLKDW